MWGRLINMTYRAAIMFFRSAWKTQTWWSCFLSSFVEFRSAVPVENVSANQRPGWPYCFSYLPEKHKLSRGCWDLATCKVSFNSDQWFQRRSWKYEKLTTDGRPPDNGQRMITEPKQEAKGPHIMHLSTMCHLLDGLARVAILFYRSAPPPPTPPKKKYDPNINHLTP